MLIVTSHLLLVSMSLDHLVESVHVFLVNQDRMTFNVEWKKKPWLRNRRRRR
jgi:hypothetical protein